MKHTIINPIAALLLLAVGLAGCSKEGTDLLPGGTQPVTLTATVEGQSAPQAAQAATRATTGNTWTGGEEVAIRIGSVVKNYVVSNHSDGTLIPNVSVEPFYWTSSTEKKTVEAWFPHSTTQPTSFTVKADQNFRNTGLGYQQSDMIYASQEITFINQSLTFHHLPVKVVVNLKEGEGVTEAEVQNATVTLVGQNLTSGAITANWSVTKLTTSGSSTITPNVLAAPTNGYLKTVQATVVPQVSTASVQFIKVSVAGQEFFYSAVLDFGAGKQHTYNITVLKTGLSVTASGAEAWTGTTTNVTSKEPIVGYADKDLKIGDYYYSDGTWSDGGYREYTDGSKTTLPIMPVLTDASGNVRTVRGIVYWVGDPTNGDPLLATNHPDCTRGLVVALHEAKQPSTSAVAKMRWSNNSEQVNNWTNHDDRGANKVDITERNKMQGYANTVALTAYNAQQTNANLKVLPIAAIEQYNKDYPAPASSSGWYVPSIMELKYVCWGQGNSQSTVGRDMLNGQFTKAGGTNFDASWYYWSSSEDNDDSGGALYVDFDSSYADLYGKSHYELWIRALFAF